MMPHDLLQVLNTRCSVPARLLGEPGPDHHTLLRMLSSASRVPDHGNLVPFRYIRITGRDRDALGVLVAARARQRDPHLSDATEQKDLSRFSQAPLVIVVVAKLRAEHRVPREEQWLTAGCSCFGLLMAAQGAGFGAQWLTGWPAHDPAVRMMLGLGSDERIAGFIHIGTPTADPAQRERPGPSALLSDWHADG